MKGKLLFPPSKVRVRKSVTLGEIRNFNIEKKIHLCNFYNMNFLLIWYEEYQT